MKETNINKNEDIAMESVDISPSSIISEVDVSLENMLYDFFYKKHGIRRFNQLDFPEISDVLDVALPKSSIYHYNPENRLALGPSEDNPWYKNEKRPKYINHVTKFSQPIEGTLAKRPATDIAFINLYRRRHRSLRLLRDFYGVNKQDNMLIIYNYGLLDNLWRYRPNRFINYYHFKNLYKTIVDTMNTVAKTSDRHQFFEVRLPKQILARSRYRLLSKDYATNGISTRIINFINDDDSLLLFHLWLWLSDERKASIFDRIDRLNYGKINLILIDGPKYTVLNLQKLDEFRKTDIDEDGLQDDLADEDGVVEKSTSAPLLLKFYKLLNALMSFRKGMSLSFISKPVLYTEKELEEASNSKDTVLDEDVEEGNVDEPKKPDISEPNTTPPSVKEAPASVTSKKKNIKDIGNLEPVPVKKAEPVKEEPLIVEEPVNKPEPKQVEKVEYVIDPDDDNADIPDVTDSITQAIIDEKLYVKDPLQKHILDKADEYLSSGSMTRKEFERVKRLANSYKTLPSPFDSNQTIEQFMKVDEKDLYIGEPVKIPDNPFVLDKGMLNITNEKARKQYLKKVYDKNIMQSVMGLQKAGILVTDVKRDIVQDAISKYEVLKVSVQPIGGTQTTLKIRLPYVNKEDGTIDSFGTKYTLKAQRKDKPIRKVTSTKVSLTSYYGKLSVYKSDKRVFNLENFIRNEIQRNILDKVYDSVQYGNTFDSELDISPQYQMISKRFKMIKFNKGLTTIILTFDYHKRFDILESETYKKHFTQSQPSIMKLEKDLNAVFSGISSSYSLLFIDKKNSLWEKNDKGERELDRIITLLGYLGLKSSPPREVAEIKIFGKSVPIGILLGYYLGLSTLLKVLNVSYRKVFRGQRSNLLVNEFEIKFNDEVWIIEDRDPTATLILNSFNIYKRYISDYSSDQFENKDTYSALLRDAGFNLSLENELNLMYQMFIDDITKDILKQMNEPTDFIPLLIRAVNLLSDMRSRKEINMDDMLIAGHQRIAGQVYNELAKTVKAMMNKPSMQSRSRLDIAENQIFRKIMEDPAMELVDDINPIHNLKEHEIVTFGGSDGRSVRSMVAHTRSYDKTDLGTISEATVDNANVAVISYLSATPNLSNVYGATKRADLTEPNASEIVSTSMLLAPATDTDDPKRVNFINIQNSHSIAIKGAQVPPVRTGYESVISHRVDDKFAVTSKGKGKVIEQSVSHIAVQYDNDEIVSYPLSTNYGVSKGKVISNKMATNFKLGDTIEEGYIVTYNPDHFTPDYFNKGQVIFKNSVLARVSFMESNDTEEDSSAISRNLAEKLVTTTAKCRNLIIPYDEEVYGLLAVGSIVDTDTILCTSVNSIFSENNMFDGQYLDTLSHLAHNTPRAKYAGMITKIEVLYYGNPENATKTIQSVIRKYNLERKQQAIRLRGEIPVTGMITESIKIDGVQLPENNLVIKIYIEDNDDMGVGDKLVFSSQLKSVCGRVMEGVNETESGIPIDAIFGYQSVSNRIVQSAELTGTTNVLLKAITKEVVDLYRSQKDA